MGFGLIEELCDAINPMVMCASAVRWRAGTVTKVRTLVTAAVANWGHMYCYLSGGVTGTAARSLHSAARLEMLEACVRAGAADGITGVARPPSTRCQQPCTSICRILCPDCQSH